MKSDAEFAGLMMRCQVTRQEYARDAYARALADWQRSRAYPAETSGYWRGAKMSATYQLRKATARVDALLREK